MGALISVIIPVYNVEKYLRECLDSIINQTYKRLEVILIDDGSTDASSKICDEYENKDSRIKVIHQANGGQGSARNVGLNIANGEYVSFLDSDDFLNLDFFEELYKKAVETNADITICNYNHVDENGVIKSDGPKSRIKQKIYTGNEAMKVILYWKEFGVAPWAKLFRMNLWKDIKYKEDRIYEDLATTYLVFYKAKTVCFYNVYKMNYRIRSNSDVHQPFNIRKAKILDSADEILSFCQNNVKDCVKAAESRELASACFIYFRIPDDELEMYSDIVKRCQTIIRKYRYGVAFDMNARNKTRLGAIVSCFGVSFARRVFNWFIIGGEK